MNRTASLALLALVVATAGIIPVVAAQPSTHVAADAGSPQLASANGSAMSSAPGATLSGTLSAHGAEIDGEVSVRAFSQAYDHAGSNRSKAGVVSAQATRLDGRLDALSARLDALRAARANDSLSDGAYTARAAAIVAQLRQTRRLANATVVAAADLPPSARASAGVDVTAIHGLSERAANLSDSPVAAAGRSIAQRHNRDNRGYSADSATRHRANAVVARADAAVARAVRTRRRAAPLSDAVQATVSDELVAANDSLASAHAALDDGRPADAIAFAADAEAHAHAVRLALTGHGDQGTTATNATSGVDTSLPKSTQHATGAVTNTAQTARNATTRNATETPTTTS